VGVEGDLSETERERYAKRLATEPQGQAAQLRLKQARVLVVGAGATGGIAAGYLAAAGVGYLGLADGGRFALSDLPAELLQLTPDVGAPKAETLAVKLGFQNPEVQIESYPVTVEGANAGAIVAGFDIVLDCTGDVVLRALLEEECERAGVGLVRAERDETAAFAGPAAGVAGALAAAETLALLAETPAEARR
jgi:adenylyltransferase/sulfurtransferase